MEKLITQILNEGSGNKIFNSQRFKKKLKKPFKIKHLSLSNEAIASDKMPTPEEKPLAESQI